MAASGGAVERRVLAGRELGRWRALARAGGAGAATVGSDLELDDAGRKRSHCSGLAIDGTEVDTWYVSASPGPRAAHGDGEADAGVYRWRDDGPWELLAGGLPRPLHDMPYALVAHDARLFVGLRSGRILVSEDHGDRWEELRLGAASLAGLRTLLPAR